MKVHSVLKRYTGCAKKAKQAVGLINDCSDIRHGKYIEIL